MEDPGWRHRLAWRRFLLFVNWALGERVAGSGSLPEPLGLQALVVPAQNERVELSRSRQDRCAVSQASCQRQCPSIPCCLGVPVSPAPGHAGPQGGDLCRWGRWARTHPCSPGIPSTPESRGGRATAGGGCRRAVRWGSRPGAWRPGCPGPQTAARKTRRRTRPWPRGRAQDSVPACPVPELSLQPLHSFQLRVRHAGDSARWGSVEEATGSGLQPQTAVCRKVGGQGEDCEPGAGETAPDTRGCGLSPGPGHTHSPRHTHIHTLAHTHTLTCTLIHIYTHSYMHTRTHIHTHTHTHTLTPVPGAAVQRGPELTHQQILEA